MGLSMMGNVQYQRRFYERALKTLQKALAIYEDLEDHAECAKMYLLVSDVHRQEGHFERAFKAADDAKDIFQRLEEHRSVATVLLTISSIHLENKDHEKAVKVVEKAVELFKEIEDIDGEANAKLTLADIYWACEEMELSNRASQQATKLYQMTKNQRSLVDALLLTTSTGMSSLVALGLTEENRKKRIFIDVLNVAKQSVLDALVIARNLQKSSLIGTALVLQAQVLVIDLQIGQALPKIKEALSIFKHTQDVVNEAATLTTSVGLYFMAGDIQTAVANANKAIIMQMELGDEDGERAARDALERVRPSQVVAAPGSTITTTPGTIEKLPGQQAVVTHSGEKLSAGVTTEAVVARLAEITTQVLNSDEGVEADVPLMQAGITSASAVQLRNEISTEVPGVDLPFTLIFDYPSINAIADFITSKLK